MLSVAQGQPWLSQGSLDVLEILSGMRTCTSTLDVLVMLFGMHYHGQEGPARPWGPGARGARARTWGRAPSPPWP